VLRGGPAPHGAFAKAASVAASFMSRKPAMSPIGTSRHFAAVRNLVATGA
jgi:hypothetical protein